ncbi:MAG: STAS domain-containing protein [Clostridia bacterium]|nr:STAS domain-containing protein [Clostridia bacterium]
MEIKKALNNQNLIISIKGRLDTMTAPQLEEEIKGVSLDEIETVTLNMRELEYISSSGLRFILVIYKTMLKQGGHLKIVNVSDMIMELFTMTGMADYIDLEKA